MPSIAANVTTFGLRRNAAWMFIGETGAALGFWAVLVILARFGGPTLVGQFSLATAVVTPIILFSQLALRQVQVADATGRFAFADYRRVRIGSTGLALAVIGGIAALGGYPAPVVLAILALALTRAWESLSDVYYGLAQRHQRLDRVAQSLLLRTALGLSAFILALVVSGELVLALLAQAAVAALVWITFDRWATRPWRAADPAAAGRPWWPVVWLSLPLGVATLLGSLNVNVPRYVLEGILGFEALGIFAALAHFVFAVHIMMTAVCQAASPRLANLFAAGDLRGFRRLLLTLFGCGAALGATGLAVALGFGRALLELVYGPAFAVEAGLFAGVMAVGLVYVAMTPFNYGLTAMQRFRLQPLIQGLGLGVNLLACLLLVPAYGLAGAIAGWGLAVACQGLLALAFNVWSLRRRASELLT